MTNDFILLVNDFVEYNKTTQSKFNLKEYLMNILNYSEEESDDIYSYYNRIMNNS